MQQSYAKLCGVTETVEGRRSGRGQPAPQRRRVRAPRRDAARANSRRAARSPSTSTRFCRSSSTWSATPSTRATSPGARTSCMTLRIEPLPGRVRISVIDNGVGIAPENMGRLFRHGFTTRKSGHGFGLHSGALAAQELGGTLRAESDGPGQGAAFLLELPVAPPETRHVVEPGPRQPSTAASSSSTTTRRSTATSARCCGVRCRASGPQTRSLSSRRHLRGRSARHRRGRTSSSTPPTRDARASTWRAPAVERAAALRDGVRRHAHAARLGRARDDRAPVGGRSAVQVVHLLRAHRLRLDRSRDRLGHSDQLLVLRKPFEPIEVLQCATALCCKWENERRPRPGRGARAAVTPARGVSRPRTGS